MSTFAPPCTICLLLQLQCIDRLDLNRLKPILIFDNIYLSCLHLTNELVVKITNIDMDKYPRGDQNGDEKINDADDDNDRFLEEMLAKAARLANEMKEISTKQSTTTSSKSSTGKDGFRRSLPKVINVQPNDDHTARSECSSLGYSLATATPSVFVVTGTSNTASDTPTMNLLSTTIENCAEGYFLKSNHQSSSKASNTCSVINEGSINNDHDEKKSCGDSVSATKPSFNIHKHHVNHNHGIDTRNVENVENMSSVDMLVRQQVHSRYVQTPPKVKRTIPHQPELSTGNPALQSTIQTVKSLSDEVNETFPKVLQSHERPTVLKISLNDDDYVPIADYSIRNTTTKASNVSGSAVKWEKITTPSINDDDYVPLKDYSRLPKANKSRFSVNESNYDRIKTSTGLSFGQKRELLVKRRRQRKRFMRRLMILGTIVALMLSYCSYRTGWLHRGRLMARMVVNLILPQPHEALPGHTNEEFIHVPESTLDEIDERVAVGAILHEYDSSPVEERNITIDNVSLVEGNDHGSEQSQSQLLLDEPALNAVGTRAIMPSVATGVTSHQITEKLSIFEPSSRRRFVEDLVQSMMQ